MSTRVGSQEGREENMGRKGGREEGKKKEG